ncbi:MAG TPA: hypothetical protein EYH11_04905 [Sulfurimonas autotrophica]|nr:hypothetical protein [Sulfurimonas autotrophica]
MMIHPATAHFAMALPVVASVFGLAYLYSKTEIMSKISTRTTLIAALAMIAAWYTGNQAGPEIYDYLSQAGKHELVEHKELGLYLAIAMGVIALIQIAGCQMKRFGVQTLAIVLLLGATATTFLQGKHGGEIVYNYGMPFKAYMIEDSLHEAAKAADEAEEDEEKVEIYEDALDDISSVSEEIDKIYGNAPKAEQTDTDE